MSVTCDICECVICEVWVMCGGGECVRGKCLPLLLSLISPSSPHLPLPFSPSSYSALNVHHVRNGSTLPVLVTITPTEGGVAPGAVWHVLTVCPARPHVQER